MLKRLVLSLFMFTATVASAQPEARKVLGEIDEVLVRVDLEQAIKELGASGSFSLAGDYTVCLAGAAAVCSRYVWFTGESDENSNAKSIAMTYDVLGEDDGTYHIEKTWRETTKTLWSASNEQDIVIAALQKLEQDYLGEGPVRSAPASHPFQIEIVLLKQNGEYDLQDKYTSESTHLIVFSESGYSRVVEWTQTYSYLVNVKDDGTSRVISVKKLQITKD